MYKALFFVAVSAAIVVAGCSGGANAPQPAPAATPVPLPPGTTIRIQPEVEVATLIGESSKRSVTARRLIADDASPAPGSSAIAVYPLGVPDPYVSTPPISFQVNTAVYLQLPAGAPFPSPAPSAAWMQFGDAGTPSISNNQNPANTIPPGLLGFFLSSPPQSPGTSRLVVSVSGAGSAEVDFVNYRALGLICTDGGLQGGSYTSALSFDASGVAVPQPAGAASDISFTGAACGAVIYPPGSEVILAFPYGATQPFAATSPATSFNGITAATFSNQTTQIEAKTLSSALSQASSSPLDTIVFKTHDGRLVKLLVIDLPLASDGSTVAGLYAFYAVSDANGVFAF